MARLLLDHLDEVASLINAAIDVLLCFDFDGTLAPIVDNPVDAVMSQQTTSSLIRLTKIPRYSVAVISGRSLDDVCQRVGLKNITYAGDHGLAIRKIDGTIHVEPVTIEYVSVLHHISAGLKLKLGLISGVVVEEKSFTTTVHYRKAIESDHAAIYESVLSSIVAYSDQFHVVEGLKIYEIRPLVNCDKGVAAKWILASSQNPNALCIYMGDDTTDEDAFSALSSGVTVKVGRDINTFAQYRLESQADVETVLMWLGGLSVS